MKSKASLSGQLAPWILAWSLLLSIAVGPSVSKDEDLYKKYELLVDVIRRVDNYYVKEVDNDKLFNAALDGMVSSLDPHSQFLTPDFYEELKISTSGEFGGLGISIGIKDGILTVISPLADTPADKAGIQPGDKIIEIEGKSTKDIKLEEAVKELRGPKGKEVTIKIWRSLKNGMPETKVVKLIRDVIKVKCVETEMLPHEIAYVKLNEFQGDSGDEVRKSVKKAKEDGAKALVLDLRRNPGGLLSAAIDVAEVFVKPGDLIVYTLGRDEKQSMKYVAESGQRLWEGPLAVLIDAGSASASEIVSGAIQDLHVGTVVGTKSFGKASVQNIYELPDGSALKLTTAHYFTDSGKAIDGNGIQPDRIVELKDIEDDLLDLRADKDKSKDPQVAAAVDILRAQLLCQESGL